MNFRTDCLLIYLIYLMYVLQTAVFSPFAFLLHFRNQPPKKRNFPVGGDGGAISIWGNQAIISYMFSKGWNFTSQVRMRPLMSDDIVVLCRAATLLYAKGDKSVFTCWTLVWSLSVLLSINCTVKCQSRREFIFMLQLVTLFIMAIT